MIQSLMSFSTPNSDRIFFLFFGIIAESEKIVWISIPFLALLIAGSINPIGSSTSNP